jgi:hypothetical protein
MDMIARSMTYPEDAARSRDLYARARKSLPGGNTRTTVYMKPFPIYAARGEGCRVWDVDGVARISRLDADHEGRHLRHATIAPINSPLATRGDGDAVQPFGFWQLSRFRWRRARLSRRRPAEATKR